MQAYITKIDDSLGKVAGGYVSFSVSFSVAASKRGEGCRCRSRWRPDIVFAVGKCMMRIRIRVRIFDRLSVSSVKGGDPPSDFVSGQSNMSVESMQALVSSEE